MNEIDVAKILEKYNDYVSIDFIMSELDVSKRTIQYALKELTQASSRNGFSIVNKRGQGYLLNVVNETEFHQYIGKNYGVFSDNLHDSISCYLALNNRYITIDELCEVFLVGRTTIVGEIDSVEKVVHPYQLFFERKQYNGWKLQGPLRDRMQMLIDYSFKKNEWLVSNIRGLKDNDEAVRFEYVLLKALGVQDYEVNAAELEEIKAWTYVYLLLKNEHFDLEQEPSQKSMHLLVVCQEVFSKMQWDVDTQFYQLFYELLAQNTRSLSTNNQLLEVVTELTTDFLIKTDDKYQTLFNEDVDFKNLLMTHVSLLVERLQENKTYSNYLTNEIAFKYPTMFTIALNYADMLEQQFSVTVKPEEVAFIAAYFAVHMEKEGKEKLNQFKRIAVVCGTGGGSALLIKFKIESFFPKATVQTFSTVERLNLESFNPNLIFTIKEINYPGNIPVIIINELVEDAQLLKIQRQLKNIDTQLDLNEATTDVFDELLNERIWKRVDCDSSYLELIESMSQELIELGYADEHYTESLLERESYMSTVYVNGVAMPHPMQMNAKRNAISVALIDGECSNIYDNEVKIVFMMCLNQTGYEALKDITKKLYDVMQDKMLVMELFASKNFIEFLSIIRRKK